MQKKASRPKSDMMTSLRVSEKAQIRKGMVIKMNEVLTFATMLMPLVVALVEVIKKVTFLETRQMPAVALVTGVVVGIAAFPFTEFALPERTWAGALAGLGAMGLFDLGKKMRRMKRS